MSRACALFSGGKDSSFALWKAILEGFDVDCIMTVRPDRPDSWMFHHPIVEVVKLQLKAMGYSGRHYVVSVSGVKESEVDELEEALSRVRSETPFETLVVGGIASEYQRRRFARIASRLGVGLYSPQWGMNPEEYMRMLVRSGFKFILTEIKTMGLPPNIMGVVVDEGLLDEILHRSKKYGFNPAFEGGEAETLVVYQPLFRGKRLCLEGSVVREAPYTYRLAIREAYISNYEDSWSDCIKVDLSDVVLRNYY